MRIRPTFVTIVLAGFVTTCSSPAGGADREESVPAIHAAAGNVRFDLYQGFCIVVHGSAGPLKKLNLFLDTGTIRSTFDSRIASKLNLRDTTTAGIVFMSGRAKAEDAVLPSLQFGPVERSNLEIVIADISSLSRTLQVRIDAIVGLDVLGQMPFVIDYSARVIRFGPVPSLGVSVPVRVYGGLAVIDAEIDHRPVQLLFDTGASSLVVFKKENRPGSDADSAGHGKERIGEFESKQVWLRSLRVGLEEFRQEPALLAQNPKPAQIHFDGLMSPAALGMSRVSVDLDAGVLAFSR